MMKKPRLRSALVATTVAGSTLAILALFVVTNPALGEAVGRKEPNPHATPFTAKVDAAARTSPKPPPPTPVGWNARTVAEVSVNIVRDPEFAGAIARLTSGAEPDPRAVGRVPTPGTPLFIRGLGAGDHNEFVVPITVAGTTIAIAVVNVDGNGLGRIAAIRGWSATPTFPGVSDASASAKASVPGDPVTKAELVWTKVLGLAEDIRPFWRLTRASGVVFYLFEDGTLASSRDLRLE
jgi:hypothetical protein